MHLRAHVFSAFAFLSITGIAGCGLTLDVDPPDPSGGFDAGGLDAGHVGADASRGDAGPPDDECRGQPDGTPCGADGASLICVDDRCELSFCGDGVVDETAGEVCDDANDRTGDGCEPISCVPSCDDPLDCDDENPCNGVEICSAGSKCEPGVPSTDRICTTPSGDDGVCDSGVCIPAGCGNGVREEGEECDDGNSMAGDGCEPDCVPSCREDLDCDDVDACTGQESCDVSAGCQRGVPPACAPEDDCHTAVCNPRNGCEITLIDMDRDGHAPEAITSCGDDCDDLDPNRYDGAPEQCNELDDDCDGDVDEEIVEIECYGDTDADGFGSVERSLRDCSCPAGTTPNAGDCFDEPTPVGEAVNPAQTRFFRMPYCRDGGPGSSCTFDYDCNGSEEREFAQIHRQCSALTVLMRCTGQGWRESVPACGDEGTWVECDGLLGPLGLICTPRDTRRAQTCR
ncbi:MopE-related protein [Sandaracinus amylolyticus]|uniref:Multiple EGF-like-domain protein 3 n=1 Tax=Sandaracinus amylolyticus TaxID=927083 RepID=A0A0F6SH14_9BACT|nr:MopE-related protein [Sandaracinus amylolyticus]AKF09649.1 Multiple EGF-like-domain protein 3 precursor [Sandaracinus amylolyticus]